MAVPQGGGTRYVGFPVRRAGTATLDSFGAGTMPIEVHPWMVGRTLVYQFGFVDTGPPARGGLSSALEVTFHP